MKISGDADTSGLIRFIIKQNNDRIVVPMQEYNNI